MPWDHCDAKTIPDDQACPECGVSKETWTMEWNVTRTFVLQRGGSKGDALRIKLLDPADNPVADEAYRLQYPTGKQTEARLGRFGKAKVKGEPGAPVRLTFPQRPPQDFLEPELEPDPDADPQAPPVFDCAFGSLFEFRVVPRDWFLSCRFLDSKGHAAYAGKSFQVEGKDGTTDADGVAVLPGMPCRTLLVSFPEGKVGVPAVQGEDVHHRVLLPFVPAAAERDPGAWGTGSEIPAWHEPQVEAPEEPPLPEPADEDDDDDHHEDEPGGVADVGGGAAGDPHEDDPEADALDAAGGDDPPDPRLQLEEDA